MKKIYKNLYLSRKSGSVLVFSLFVMMISLIIGVSLMSTSSVGRKSTLSSAKSVNSYQVADSGIEYAYWKIRDYRWNEADGNNVLEGDEDLDDVFGGDCVVESGVAVVNRTANGGDYKLYFYRGATGTTSMNTCTDNNSKINQITKIKAVGNYNGITRSVEATADFTDL